MSAMVAQWEPVIGLEVHCQLLTDSKLFCACHTAFGGPPNTHVCPTCLGLPGALPALNGKAVELAVRVGLALGCSIRSVSRFARKNYFYPDLPKGYQISQYDEPFCDHGALLVTMAEGATPKRARVLRVHIEEDAGKTVHGTGGHSVVDLNRAGVPLVEIVGEPDLSSPREAAEYLRTLRELVVFLGVNDGNLEEGSFRCDANVSIRPTGSERLGTRVELKNINSFRFVEKALSYEIQRQKEVLESGGCIIQETRGWDEASGTTFSLRSKEAANDYRYFPDPDLPALHLSAALVERIGREMPELPRAKRDRWMAAFGLTPYAAQVLTQHPRVAQFYEDTVAAAVAQAELTDSEQVRDVALRVANFVQSEVLRDVVTRGAAAQIPIREEHLARVVGLVREGAISGKQAKELYSAIVERGVDADTRIESLVHELGLIQLSDESSIEAVCRQVITGNPKQAEQFRAGKTALLGFFVGQVMKATKGNANPQRVNDVLTRLLTTP